MKFTGIDVWDGSYIKLKFDEHNASDCCYGDQVWSDGRTVEVHECADGDAIEHLMDLTDNQQALKGALMRLDIL